jgi:CRISPR-associated protein Csb1
MSVTTTLKPKELLADTSRHRVVLHAVLVPVTGDRFQPAGFPEIGHVIYKAPRQSGVPDEICIVDSAASMANHLETVCLASPFALDMHDDLAGLPYVACVTNDGSQAPTRLVVSSFSEGHRLASSYFLSDKAFIMSGAAPSAETFMSRLLKEFGMQDLGTKTHPLPDDWWNVFKTIFRYDPNSLVHGILFPSLGIKIPRVLTAHHEAFGAARVGSSGVKFDKLGKTNSGQPIFAVDEETAREIRATFVLDLSLIRSFGRGKNGLNDDQKAFLLAFALWKIAQLLAAPFRFRSNCDLRLDALTWVNGDHSQPEQPKDQTITITDISPDIVAAIKLAAFRTNGESEITKVWWPATELFQPGKDRADKAEDTAGEEPTEDSSENSEEESA